MERKHATKHRLQTCPCARDAKAQILLCVLQKWLRHISVPYRKFLLHTVVQVIKYNNLLTSGKILWLEMQANTASQYYCVLY